METRPILSQYLNYLTKRNLLLNILIIRKNEKNLNDCKIFGPRNDSQDTWIFHSKFLPSDNQIIRTNFLLGKAGCDNAIAYLFNDFGFIVFNEPYVIRTYHYHLSQIRNYTAIDKINPPYLLIKPIERSDLQIRS